MALNLETPSLSHYPESNHMAPGGSRPCSPTHTADAQARTPAARREASLWSDSDEEFYRRMFWPDYAPSQYMSPQHQTSAQCGTQNGSGSSANGVSSGSRGESPVQSPRAARLHAQMRLGLASPRASAHTISSPTRFRLASQDGRPELSLSPRPRRSRDAGSRPRLSTRWAGRCSSFTESSNSGSSGTAGSSSVTSNSLASSPRASADLLPSRSREPSTCGSECSGRLASNASSPKSILRSEGSPRDFSGRRRVRFTGAEGTVV